MSLFIEIYSGPKKGSRVPLNPGISIGRRKADILIDDPKISGTHAKIKERPDGFYIVDLQSANGIKVNDVRFEELRLAAGVNFVLGQTEFRVFDEDQMTKEIIIEKEKSRDWQEIVKDLLLKCSNSLQDREVRIQPFVWPIKMQIVQGAQYGTVWTLGYGPRAFGSQTYEFLIEEYGCPEIAFELHPQKDGVQFTTAFPEIVKLNAEETQSARILEGDIIEIRNTKIKFSLEKNP